METKEYDKKIEKRWGKILLSIGTIWLSWYLFYMFLGTSRTYSPPIAKLVRHVKYSRMGPYSPVLTVKKVRSYANYDLICSCIVIVSGLSFAYGSRENNGDSNYNKYFR